MELFEYLSEERGRCARIARALSVAAGYHIAAGYLSQMAAGTRPVPPELAPQLSAECEGKVPIWNLRKGDWFRIWPHLIGTEGAPSVPIAGTPPGGVPADGSPVAFARAQADSPQLRSVEIKPRVASHAPDDRAAASDLASDQSSATRMCFGDRRRVDRDGAASRQREIDRVVLGATSRPSARRERKG